MKRRNEIIDKEGEKEEDDKEKGNNFNCNKI